MLNRFKNFTPNHTPLFDHVNLVENHPSHKRGIFVPIKFPFPLESAVAEWQSRNEIDRVGQVKKEQIFFSKIIANFNNRVL